MRIIIIQLLFLSLLEYAQSVITFHFLQREYIR